MNTEMGCLAILAIALMVGGVLVAPIIMEKMEQIEYARTERAYARVELARAHSQAWLDFSQAMFPWFVVSTTLFVGLLIGGFVAYRMTKAEQQQTSPTIYVLAPNRREALEGATQLGFPLEGSNQVVLIEREE